MRRKRDASKATSGASVRHEWLSFCSKSRIIATLLVNYKMGKKWLKAWMFNLDLQAYGTDWESMGIGRDWDKLIVLNLRFSFYFYVASSLFCKQNMFQHVLKTPAKRLPLRVL